MSDELEERPPELLAAMQRRAAELQRYGYSVEMVAAALARHQGESVSGALIERVMAELATYRNDAALTRYAQFVRMINEAAADRRKTAGGDTLCRE